MENLVYFSRRTDKVFGFLTALYITSLLTNLTIGYRYISIWHLNEAGGIFIFPLSFIVGDILSEVYDSSYAKKLIWYGVLCEAILALYTHFIIRMPFPGFWSDNKLYYEVMNPYLRFTIASSGAILIGSWLNIHLLSKWSRLVQGKYFILRSLGASFIGESFVTVSSMLIANLGRMELGQLTYMMACCFILKTIVTFIAVWPAALVVCLLKNNELEENGKWSTNFLKKLLNSLRQFSKPYFRLEKINIENNTANIFCRGARVVINKKIPEIICNAEIINNMQPVQASYIGYYYGFLTDTNNDHGFLLNQKKKRVFELRFKKYRILSIERDGKINYKSTHSDEVYTKFPINIYRNESISMHFTPSQACYIGILAGISQKKLNKESPVASVSRLRLVNNDEEDFDYTTA